MARKRRGKSADTDLKAQQALEAVASKPGKTRQEIADELEINRNTLSDRVKRALSHDAVQEIVQTSRNRLIEMLSRCDEAYHRVLTWNHPDNFGNQIRVATSIYKTFGLIEDESQIKAQNIIPIQIVIKGSDGSERVYTAGNPENRLSPKTGDGVRGSE